MFTGIIEEAGQIVALDRVRDSMRLAIRASVAGRDVKVGDSIAVNGCCLTVVGVGRKRSGIVLEFDLLEETWRRTSFRALGTGRSVNLERSLSVNGRFGGHFVTG